MREITVETVLRRIEKYCREEISVWNNPKSEWRLKAGALGECRGAVQTCREMLGLCRILRQEKRHARSRN